VAYAFDYAVSKARDNGVLVLGVLMRNQSGPAYAPVSREYSAKNTSHTSGSVGAA